MRVSINEIMAMKANGERIAMLTAYDYTMATLVESAGIPLILVGDTLGMIMLGNDSTIPVTLNDIIHHTRAVVRGTKKALIVADMPFMTYQVSIEEAIRNAGRLMQETGCQAVKLEGGEWMADTIASIVRCGIPVMGHLGFTPQSVNIFGGPRVQGKTEESAAQIIRDAQALEEAGAFAIVLELVPQELAAYISERISIPTIGIGAGPDCDGEVQVLHDILGMYPDFTPRHTRRFAEVGTAIKTAIEGYIAAVHDSSFPTAKQSSHLDPKVLALLKAEDEG
ncbi:MAG: 3-methyl-2-oxobutanoate hydroxymethyltransferase [Ktedonobacterales bacterium]|nr:3-methyl-2-oxobutanoate hydroxymethyltransferase [Ktedonobacterales bacterium]